MRYLPLMLAVITGVCTCRPLQSIPELEEIFEQNRHVFPLVENVPDLLLPEGMTDLIFAAVPIGEMRMTVYLLGDGPEGMEVLASGPYRGEYNFAKSFASWLPEESILELVFQMPYSARYAGVQYAWEGEDLVPVQWLTGDPSLETLSDVDSLLASGCIDEAAAELATIFYPGYYYEPGQMAAGFLRTAHEYAMEEYEAGNIEAAVNYYEETGEAMDLLLMPYPWYGGFQDSSDYAESGISDYMTIGAFTCIANDYGFFLEQYGNYEKAVDVLYGVLTLDPKRMVAYLNIADALWGLGERGNAAEFYRNYADMMMRVNLGHQIPHRVNRRVLAE